MAQATDRQRTFASLLRRIPFKTFSCLSNGSTTASIACIMMNTTNSIYPHSTLDKGESILAQSHVLSPSILYYSIACT